MVLCSSDTCGNSGTNDSFPLFPTKSYLFVHDGPHGQNKQTMPCVPKIVQQDTVRLSKKWSDKNVCVSNNASMCENTVGGKKEHVAYAAVVRWWSWTLLSRVKSLVDRFMTKLQAVIGFCRWTAWPTLCLSKPCLLEMCMISHELKVIMTYHHTHPVVAWPGYRR